MGRDGGSRVIGGLPAVGRLGEDRLQLVHVLQPVLDQGLQEDGLVHRFRVERVVERAVLPIEPLQARAVQLEAAPLAGATGRRRSADLVAAEALAEFGDPVVRHGPHLLPLAP